MKTLDKLRRSNKLIVDMNVVGFLSVLLVLLSVYLANSYRGHPRNSHDVYLASVNHPKPMPDAERDDAIIIAISKDGKIWIGSDTIEATDLRLKIRQYLSQGSPPVVYLRADARVPYRYVGGALDAVRSSGLERVVFILEKTKVAGVITQ
jgi:biopolymer transport protein TolR